MSRRPNSRAIKQQLFLKCGRVDMYNMEKYAKEKLVLHHYPPFRLTHHTIYEESYILSEETHVELHKLELNDHEEYERRMEIIKENKKILERKRGYA
jgi:hypothetical protein